MEAPTGGANSQTSWRTVLAPHGHQQVFWVVDNGSSHDPRTFQARLSRRYPKAIAVHLPIHASWLNQVEAYYSILQRKALTPNDFDSTEALTKRILWFQARFNQMPQPFNWRFTKADLARYLKRTGLH